MATRIDGDYSRKIISDPTRITNRSITLRILNPCSIPVKLVFKSLSAMDDVTDLTGDGGVIKKIVTRAKAGALAPSEDLPMVDVHYEGTLAETGEVFDTTHEDNSVFSFELGKGTVIQAWDIALKSMKVGEVAKITCKPEYAYGAAGSPPDIPPKYLILIFIFYCYCNAIACQWL
ncbi:FKBP-like peptidyl-prolyl cis-trans isomerase family protein [Gossypium australe]|uniref:peptidylprolyl isomerase n=1 Tax=Gossypium australe TaxID=47621 RepID=A0A5B6WBS3_9ROSI|nr:FKBP-like peptidyl-prolyl cis-trans isomerase family protein [Gossypium australe]